MPTIDPISGLSTLMSILGGIGAGNVSDAARRDADLANQNALNAANLGYQNSIPFLNTAQQANAALQALNPQMLGQLAYLMGVPTGTQFSLPQTRNTAVNEALVPYASATPGTWQNDLYRWGTANNANAAQVTDIVKDITGGENALGRLKRSGWADPGADYVAPSAYTAGQTVSVPGAGSLPSYMQVPDVDSILQRLQAADDAGLEQLRQELQGSAQNALASRGFMGPNVSGTVQTGTQANVPLYMQREKATQGANLAQLGYGMKMNNNSYLQGVAQNLLNSLSGQVGMGMNAGNTAGLQNQWNNLANQQNALADDYSNQSQQNWANAGLGLGQLGQSWWDQLQASRTAKSSAQPSQGVLAARSASSPSGGYQPWYAGVNVANPQSYNVDTSNTFRPVYDNWMSRGFGG